MRAGANTQASAIRSTLTGSGTDAASCRERVSQPRTAWRPGREDCCCGDPISLPCTETCIAHHKQHSEFHNQMSRESRPSVSAQRHDNGRLLSPSALMPRIPVWPGTRLSATAPLPAAPNLRRHRISAGLEGGMRRPECSAARWRAWTGSKRDCSFRAMVRRSPTACVVADGAVISYAGPAAEAPATPAADVTGPDGHARPVGLPRALPGSPVLIWTGCRRSRSRCALPGPHAT